LRYGRVLSFGHLNFEDLEFVSDFDIRISNLFSARKNTNLRTKELTRINRKKRKTITKTRKHERLNVFYFVLLIFRALRRAP